MNHIVNSTKPAPRAYKVSRERLIAFKALTVEQRLKWVEESAAFLRLAIVTGVQTCALPISGFDELTI